MKQYNIFSGKVEELPISERSSEMVCIDILLDYTMEYAALLNGCADYGLIEEVARSEDVGGSFSPQLLSNSGVHKYSDGLES